MREVVVEQGLVVMALALAQPPVPPPKDSVLLLSQRTDLLLRQSTTQTGGILTRIVNRDILQMAARLITLRSLI